MNSDDDDCYDYGHGDIGAPILSARHGVWYGVVSSRSAFNLSNRKRTANRDQTMTEVIK